MEGSTQRNGKSYADNLCVWYEVVDVRFERKSKHLLKTFGIIQRESEGIS